MDHDDGVRRPQSRLSSTMRAAVGTQPGASGPAARPVRHVNHKTSRGWDIASLILLGAWVVVGAADLAFGVRVAVIIDRLEQRPTAALTDAFLDAASLDETLQFVRIGAIVATAIALAVWSVRI